MRLKFQKAATRDEAAEGLGKGTIELLLADAPPLSGDARGGVGEGLPKRKSEIGNLRSEIGDLKSEIENGKPVELGRMAVGVIVHPENPLESLPLDEARTIFTGEIKKWPAVRGAAAAMHVFGLKPSSPITQLLKEKLACVSGTLRVPPAIGTRSVPDTSVCKALKFTAEADNEKVILAVARDPAAIGFVDLGQLAANEKSVKLVKILGTTSAENAKDDASPLSLAPASLPEDYPLSRTLTLYVSPKAGQAAKDFAEFLTPEHCKETIAKYNLLPSLRTEDAKQLAKAPQPRRNEGEIKLTADEEPVPPLLDDPDAGQDRPPAMAKKRVAEPQGEVRASEPEPARLAADTRPSADTMPEPSKAPRAAPSLLDKHMTWIICGLAGAVVLAICAGCLQAPKRKKPRPQGPREN